LKLEQQKFNNSAKLQQLQMGNNDLARRDSENPKFHNQHNSPSPMCNPTQIAQTSSGKKILFSSSMLKMGMGHGEKERDLNYDNNTRQIESMQSRLNKNIPNNVISSANAIKRDHGFGGNMRTGGSPGVGDIKSKGVTSKNKAGNFFKEGHKQTGLNKSPNNADFSKKNFGKSSTHVDKSKDGKKPFN